MSDKQNPVDIVFLPGCFDEFEGTQEELDELIKEIQDIANSGELLTNAMPLDLEDLVGDLDNDQINDLIQQLSDDADNTDFPLPRRTLQ